MKMQLGLVIMVPRSIKVILYNVCGNWNYDKMGVREIII